MGFLSTSRTYADRSDGSYWTVELGEPFTTERILCMGDYQDAHATSTPRANQFD
jgi:hypothetical protein